MKLTPYLSLLCLLFALSACKSEKEIEVQKVVSAATVELTLDAKDLLNDYSKNSTDAEDKYADKFLLVEGEITDIDTAFVKVHRGDKDTTGGIGNYLFNWFVDAFNDPSLVLEKEIAISTDSTTWKVLASFPTEYFPEMKKLTLGQRVKLKCKCTGFGTIRHVDSNDKTLGHWNTIHLRGCLVQ